MHAVVFTHNLVSFLDISECIFLLDVYDKKA